MIRAFVRALLLPLLIAAAASADVLVLRDGRTFEGVVSVGDDTVEIQLDYGDLRFARSEVLRIEFRQTPRSRLDEMLAATGDADADALFGVAQWAAENELIAEADELYEQVVGIEPDHAAARAALGHVKIDGQWRDFATAVELARGKLEAGRYDVLFNEILPRVEPLAPSPDDARKVQEIRALTALRSGRFAEAGRTFAALAEAAGEPEATRFAAIAAILADNADGMYVLSEAYPPKSALVDSEGDSVPAGPASLARPLVLEAALRDRAKAHIAAGRELLDAARAADASDPDEAESKYVQAGRSFDRADALVEDIARSYRVEIARRRIAAIRRQTDTDTRRFDAAVNKLGKSDMAPQEYRALVRTMLRNLDDVQGKLRTILDIARPFSRDLVLEIQWAESDLRKVESMRDVLAAEIKSPR